jgi:cell division ATPase FtsA
VRQCGGVKIDELVASGFRLGRRGPVETEGLGVAVAASGGTIDLAMFSDGSPFRTAVLPIGGNNVTMSPSG